MINGLILPTLQRFQRNHRIRRALDTANFGKGLELGLDPQIYLKRFLKSGVPPDSISLAAMKIDFFSDKTYRHSSYYTYCAHRYDALFYFALAYQDQKGDRWGLALLGFRVSPWRKTVFVEQIQGIHINPEYSLPKKEAWNKLQSFRWEKMLIKFVEDWATLNMFSRIGIRQARFNYWRRNGKHLSDTEVQHNERLRMRYDITARRMGYKTPWYRGLFRGYHYKKLKS